MLFRSALLAEIVAEDGSMARGATLTEFAREHNIPIISIAEIMEYQSRITRVTKVAKIPHHEFEWVDVQLSSGVWKLATYPSLKHREHVVMRYGEPHGVPLVRMHSECFTGDVVHSQRCDCGEQLAQSIQSITEHGYGYILYLREIGRAHV